MLEPRTALPHISSNRWYMAQQAGHDVTRRCRGLVRDDGPPSATRLPFRPVHVNAGEPRPMVRGHNVPSRSRCINLRLNFLASPTGASSWPLNRSPRSLRPWRSARWSEFTTHITATARSSFMTTPWTARQSGSAHHQLTDIRRLTRGAGSDTYRFGAHSRGRGCPRVRARPADCVNPIALRVAGRRVSA